LDGEKPGYRVRAVQGGDQSMYVSGNLRRVGVVGVLAVLVFVLTACHYIGSGTMTSATGTGKAVFSFDLSCTPGTNVQKGTLTYVDNPAHVQLRGTVDTTTNSSTCATNSDWGEGDFYGTYTALTGGPTGTFSLYVKPGNSGSATKATFELHLYGGSFAGYHNSGTVAAGTITTVGGPNA
jgi:hypothetical protein